MDGHKSLTDPDKKIFPPEYQQKIIYSVCAEWYSRVKTVELQAPLKMTDKSEGHKPIHSVHSIQTENSNMPTQKNLPSRKPRGKIQIRSNEKYRRSNSYLHHHILPITPFSLHHTRPTEGLRWSRTTATIQWWRGTHLRGVHRVG